MEQNLTQKVQNLRCLIRLGGGGLNPNETLSHSNGKFVFDHGPYGIIFVFQLIFLRLNQPRIFDQRMIFTTLVDQFKVITVIARLLHIFNVVRGLGLKKVKLVQLVIVLSETSRAYDCYSIHNDTILASAASNTKLAVFWDISNP